MAKPRCAVCQGRGALRRALGPDTAEPASKRSRGLSGVLASELARVGATLLALVLVAACGSDARSAATLELDASADNGGHVGLVDTRDAGDVDDAGELPDAGEVDASEPSDAGDVGPPLCVGDGVQLSVCSSAGCESVCFWTDHEDLSGHVCCEDPRYPGGMDPCRCPVSP